MKTVDFEWIPGLTLVLLLPFGMHLSSTQQVLNSYIHSSIHFQYLGSSLWIWFLKGVDSTYNL